MTEKIMPRLLTGGIVSSKTIEGIKEKATKFINETTPNLIKSGVKSLKELNQKPLAHKLKKGVAIAALLSGYATTGAGHVIQTMDRIQPQYMQDARNVMVSGTINGSAKALDGIYSIYEHAPIKGFVDDVSKDVGRLANTAIEAIPTTVREPVGRIGARLASFAHQETAKLIPDSMTQGKVPVEALKRFKESAGR